MDVLTLPLLPATGAFDTQTNADCVVTLAISGTIYKVGCGGVAWSYAQAPTGGRIYVRTTNAAGVAQQILLDLDITQDGPGVVYFNPMRVGLLNENIVATLFAGGAGIVGKLNLLGAFQQNRT